MCYSGVQDVLQYSPPPDFEPAAPSQCCNRPASALQATSNLLVRLWQPESEVMSLALLERRCQCCGPATAQQPPRVAPLRASSIRAYHWQVTAPAPCILQGLRESAQPKPRSLSRPTGRVFYLEDPHTPCLPQSPQYQNKQSKFKHICLMAHQETPTPK